MIERLLAFAHEHDVHFVLKGKHPSSRTVIYYLVVDSYKQKFMNKLSEFERVADLPEIQVLPLRNYEKQGAEVWRNSKYKKSA